MKTPIALFTSCSLALLATVAFSQPKFSFGTETGLLFVSAKDPLDPDTDYRFLGLRFKPKLGAFLTRHILVGAQAEYEFEVVNQNFPAYPDIYGLGYFVKFYPGDWERRSVFRIKICDGCATLHMFPFAGVEHNFTNRQLANGILTGLEALSTQEITPEVGVGVRLGGRFYYEMSLKRSFYPGGEVPGGLYRTGTLQFYFPGKNFQQPSLDCNSSLFMGLLTCRPKGENDVFTGFGNLIIGSSLTYIWDPRSRSQNLGEDHLYQETTWNINVATDMTGSLRLGLSGMQIFTQSPDSGDGKYFLVGSFGQYNFTPRAANRNRLYFETGLFYGNYCTCGAYDPYLKDGLTYLDLGAGYSPRIWKNLYLDLGFNVYNMLKKLPGKYSFTQYVVGLEYRIGK